MTGSYVDLVRTRLRDRGAHIESSLEKLGDRHLRFTVRLFGDCLDAEKRRELLGSWSEYRTEEELREFVRAFLPAYTAYAVAELEEKKREGERFDPPWLTQEEYQEMSVREKWPRIARCLPDVPPLQLRREIARAAMLFRPYMLSDPGFNEGVLEFALYFDLMERLEKADDEAVRAAAAGIDPLIGRAVAAGEGEACEGILREIRTLAAGAAGLPADPEALLGPDMERYPREAPPEWRFRELRKILDGMNLKDLRLSVLSHIDLLTSEETREVVAPFMARFPSFYEIPRKYLREIVLAIAEKSGDRAVPRFIERYAEGRMAMIPPVSFVVWKLMPEGERIARLREDNAAMDAAMMARHLARFLMAAVVEDLFDAARQATLLVNPHFISNHGYILKNLGGDPAGERIKGLYDEVTVAALRMMSGPAEERKGRLEEIRNRIALASGLSIKPPEGGE